MLRLVVKNGMSLALIGIVVGLGGAWGLTRFLASLLVGSQRYRCVDLECGFTAPVGGGPTRLLRAGATRHESRSAGGLTE